MLDANIVAMSFCVDSSEALTIVRSNVDGDAYMCQLRTFSLLSALTMQKPELEITQPPLRVCPRQV